MAGVWLTFGLWFNDTQQSINLELKRVFNQEKIAFAFPRQDVFLVK
ncbi:MAG TPA: hypothetical protein PKX21_00985 [Candidatus Pacearchaeota archaeon]|nr:hypothetical protein [Candidatus Pacearchaeota archaeon]